MDVDRLDYRPPSRFLNEMIERTGDLGDSKDDRRTLLSLIRMTRDRNPDNRDWATMLLWQQGVDTPEVRDALILAASDPNEGVRAEAIRGLAQLDRTLALPLVRQALSSNTTSAPIFEAAAIIADHSLIEDLRAFAEPSGNDYLDNLAYKALTACQRTSMRR